MIDGPDNTGNQEPAFLGAAPAALPPIAADDGDVLADIYGGNIPEKPASAAADSADNGAKVLPRTISEALRTGDVSEAAVTHAAGHVLLQMKRFGLLDGQPRHREPARSIVANANIIERTAEEAAVLLKNEGGALPLKAADLDSMVLIGLTAGQVDAIGISGER